MEMVQKIPINERLQNIESNIPNFLKVFEIFIDDYFEGLVQMTGNPYFKKVYEKEIKKYNFVQNMDALFVEMVHFAESLFMAEENKLLYKILVQPFAMMEDDTGEEKKI